MNLPEFTWIYLDLLDFFLNLPEFTWIYLHILQIVHIVNIGFTWIHLGLLVLTWVYSGSLGLTWVYSRSLGLILVDVGYLVCRVLNLENESTHKHTDRRFLGWTEILSDLITSLKYVVLSKNPAYGRQSISRPMRIVAPMP